MKKLTEFQKMIRREYKRLTCAWASDDYKFYVQRITIADETCYESYQGRNKIGFSTDLERAINFCREKINQKNTRKSAPKIK